MVENGDGGGKCFTAGWNAVAKPCDICKVAAALLFCRKHITFLCMACDSKLHAHTKHERVWICEVCEQAPASVTCKADVAVLCITCDKDIHSANPLASRHERVPVVTFYDSAEAVVNCTAASLIDPVSCYGTTELTTPFEFPPVSIPSVVKSIDLYTADNPFFDFGFAIPTDFTLNNHLHDSVSDCVVPVQTIVAQIVHHKSPYEIDLTRSASMNSYNKSSSQSHSHSVCTSSIEPGALPEENSMLEISNPLIIPVNVGGANIGPKARQFCAVDREARVLRYREKRKNRKFENKIRYASRKAYAEKRSRIKGRFVKQTELRTELDVDQWLFTPEANINSYGPEVEYGVVPSF